MNFTLQGGGSIGGLLAGGGVTASVLAWGCRRWRLHGRWRSATGSGAAALGGDGLGGGGLGGDDAQGGAAAAPRNRRATTIGTSEVLCVRGASGVDLILLSVRRGRRESGRGFYTP
jgi:hypothetical protein